MSDLHPKLFTLIWAVITVVFILVSSFLVASLARLIARLAGKSQLFQARTFAGYFFASPWIVGFVIWVVGPALVSFYWSLTRFELPEPPVFIGLENYIRLLFEDDKFHVALLNSAYMTVIGVPLQIITALCMALLVNQRLPGVRLFRAIYYLPVVLAGGAAILLAWRLMLNPNNGLVNLLLTSLGDVLPPVNWLVRLFVYLTELSNAFFMALQRGNWTIYQNIVAQGFPGPDRVPLWHQHMLWSKPAIIMVGLWSAGSGMLIYLAALQGVPRELYDAAVVDGANNWEKFWLITFPMITPATFYNLVVGIIATLQIFDQSYVLTTDGGPAQSTYFVAYYLWRSTFRFNRIGYGAAMSWILLVIILVLTLIQFRLANRWVYYEAEQ